MSDELKMIHFEDCYLENDGEPAGDGRINVCDSYGSALFSVAEGEYPKGTLFDVTITYIPKQPRKTPDRATE
jgi:hypothetical protein